MNLLRALERLNVFMGVLSGLAILLITLTIVADVALRVVLNQPIPGATEFSTLLMIALVYLGLGSVQVSKANFRVEVGVGLLPPRLRRALNLLTTLVAMGAIAVLLWFTGQEAWTSVSRREMSFGAFTFPVYPARITIAVGFCLLMLQLLIDAIRLIVSFISDPEARGAS